MIIRELTILNDTAIHISWTISDGEQRAYDLFLIQNGAVVERSKASSAATGCTLHTPIHSLTEYTLLLTVTVGEKLATARASFFGNNYRLQVYFR